MWVRSLYKSLRQCCRSDNYKVAPHIPEKMRYVTLKKIHEEEYPLIDIYPCLKNFHCHYKIHHADYIFDLVLAQLPCLSVEEQ